MDKTDEERVVSRVLEKVSSTLLDMLEQFALDEEDNYLTIERWANGLIGVSGDGIPVHEDGSPATPPPPAVLESVKLGDTVEEGTVFGEESDSGLSDRASRADHNHGTPADPLPAHLGSSDPHEQYVRRFEPEDPLPQYQKRDEKAQPDGYAPLDEEATVPKTSLKATWFNEGSVWFPGHKRLTADYYFPEEFEAGDLFVHLEL